MRGGYAANSAWWRFALIGPSTGCEAKGRLRGLTTCISSAQGAPRRAGNGVGLPFPQPTRGSLGRGLYRSGIRLPAAGTRSSRRRARDARVGDRSRGRRRPGFVEAIERAHAG